MNVVDFIARKRDGLTLTGDEIRTFIRGVSAGTVPDYQTSAWLMATFLRGMNRQETLDLTLAMRDSGDTIDLSTIPNGPALDKHSTGGVGDKTTLIVVPIIAAAGVPMLKMSGRGLGFSGGTVDKLEAIPGFRTGLSIAEARNAMGAVGAAIIAQTGELAPADKVLYGLRDVTATVECIPLIAASIMSKKLAAGGQRIVLDVKCGAGAFMKSEERARELAEEMVAIGNGAGVPTIAVLSRMDEPLGYTVGNSLEVQEAIDILIGDWERWSEPSANIQSYIDLCIELAATGLVATGRILDLEEARTRCIDLLKTGAAAQKFVEIVASQGGPGSIEKIRASLPVARTFITVTSTKQGTVTGIDAETVGRLATEIGAGRMRKSDQIDPAVGVWLNNKVGAAVEAGSLLATIYVNDAVNDGGMNPDDLADRLRAAYSIDDVTEANSGSKSLVLGTIGV